MYAWPLPLIQLENAENQVLDQRVDVVVEVNLPVIYLLDHVVHVLSPKRSLVVEQLVQQDAQRPDIGLFALSLAEQNFGGHVLVSSAKSLAHFVGIVHGAPTEIAELDVEVGIQQDVLGLEVSVHDVAVVDVLHSQRSLVKELHFQHLADLVLVPVEVAEQVSILRVL